MLLEIVSWDGHTLNDSNYAAFFPFGQPSMPGASPNWAKRTRTWAKLASKQIDGATLSFHVICLGTFHSQYETLKSWFRVDNYAFKTLVVKDTADSNRQWYVKGYVTQPLAPAGEGTAGEYVVTLALDEPLWRTVTANTDPWTITASGQTNTLTLHGNQPARPIFTITIGGAKSGGYIYRWWRPWYNPLTVENGEPLEITNGGWDTAALIADTSRSNQINQVGGITNSTLSIPVDTAVGGGLSTTGGMCYVDTEQIYYTGISGGVMTVAANGRGYGGTTAATHADNAVMKFSQLMANGQDLRVQMNREFVDYWVSGINTSSTKIWIVPKFGAKIELVQSGAISNATAAPFTVNVTRTAANLAALKRLPSSFIFKIDNEIFYGGSVDAVNYKFTCTARAQRGTSAATHATGGTIRWIEHDIYLLWGNALAEAAEVDDTRKPMLNLSSSTNTSWVHAEFASDDGLRSAGWKSAVIKQVGTESYLYTDTQGALADPATVMGMAIKPFMYNGVLKPETFTYAWQLYHPGGFTTATASGSKRRLSTDWPATMAFQKSADGKTWITVWNEATPSSSGSFGALTSHSGVSLGAGTWRYVRFYGNGSLKATVGNEADMEAADTTMVITSASVLQQAVTTTPENTYYLDATLTVDETDEAFTLKGVAAVGSVIVVNCDAETLTVDGVEGTIGIFFNTVREGWLDIPSPEQSATCTLIYEETGVANVSVSTGWEDRNTL